MPEAAQQPPPAAQEQDYRDIAPAFHEDMTLREMKARFSSNMGALTCLSNQVRVRAQTFIAIKSPGSASQLNESYNKFLTKCDFLHRAAHQLALLDEANAENWLAPQDQLQPLQDQIEHIYGDAQVQLGVASPPAPPAFESACISNHGTSRPLPRQPNSNAGGGNSNITIWAQTWA